MNQAAEKLDVPHALTALGVWLTTLIVYAVTKAPTLSFWDCGEFIAASYILGIPHPPGTPVYILIGRIFSLLPLSSDIAVRVNYLSVISSSFTALFGYLAAARILRAWIASRRSTFARFLTCAGSAAGALFLAFGVTNWNNSVEAEVYGLAMALMTLTFWLTLIYAEKRGTPAAERIMLLIVYLGFLGIGVHMTVVVGVAVAAFLFILGRTSDTRVWFLTAVFVAFELYLVFALSSRPSEIPYSIPVTIVFFCYLFYIFSFERIPGRQLVVAAGFLVAMLPLLARVALAFKLKQSSIIDADLISSLGVIGKAAMIMLCAWAAYSLWCLLHRRDSAPGRTLDLPSAGFVAAASLMIAILYLPKGYHWFLVVGGAATIGYLWLVRESVSWPVLVALAGVMLVVLGVKPFWYGMLGATAVVVFLAVTGRVPRWKTALMIILCAAAGYSVHLFIPIRSAQQPSINENNPSSSLAATISFLERKQYGSQPMIPRMFERRGEWKNQLGNYRRMGFWGFFQEQYGLTGRWFVLLFLPGVFGIWETIRRHAHLGLPLLLLVLLCSVGLVLYMNFADGTRQDLRTGADHIEVRDRDYFFTPAFVFFGLAVGMGAAIIIRYVRDGTARLSAVSGSTLVAASCVLLLLPLAALAGNYHRCDRSRNYIPYDYACNILNSARPHAVLFTYGDNDTFPLWCVQEVYGVRPDVRVANLSLANGKWYIKQLKHNMNIDLGWTDDQIDRLKPYRTSDGALFHLQDLVVDAVVDNGRGEIPVCFAITVGSGARTYRGRPADSMLVLDGMVWRVDEAGEPLRVDVESSYKFYTDPDGFRSRGVNDPSVYKDETSWRLTGNWANPFISVADTLRRAGDYDRAEHLARLAVERIPHASEAVHYLAQLYLEQGKIDQLRALVSTTSSGDRHQLLLLLGRAEITQQRHREAEQAFLSVLAEDPANRAAFQELTRLYLAAGRLSSAEGLLQQWLRLNPDDAAARNLLNQIHQAARGSDSTKPEGT